MINDIKKAVVWHTRQLPFRMLVVTLAISAIIVSVSVYLTIRQLFMRAMLIHFVGLAGGLVALVGIVIVAYTLTKVKSGLTREQLQSTMSAFSRMGDAPLLGLLVTPGDTLRKRKLVLITITILLMLIFAVTIFALAMRF